MVRTDHQRHSQLIPKRPYMPPKCWKTNTSPPRQVCTQTKPHDLMMDEIPGSITETVPRQSRFSRAANGKPGTFCVDSETLNKFVSVRTVTRSLSTEFKQNLNKEESKPWKKTNISYFSL